MEQREGRLDATSYKAIDKSPVVVHPFFINDPIAVG